jgi:hypothetical protein
MYLTRVRFTVGSLLFAVAVVAANCWAFRCLTETDVSAGGRITYHLLPAGVGALPLVNAALIGTWLLAVRRLRSLRHGRADGPRSLSIATYFWLNFMLLGGLVCLFIPDAVYSSHNVLDLATKRAAESW